MGRGEAEEVRVSQERVVQQQRQATAPRGPPTHRRSCIEAMEETDGSRRRRGQSGSVGEAGGSAATQ